MSKTVKILSTYASKSFRKLVIRSFTGDSALRVRMPRSSLDDLDFSILQVLLRNSRVTFRELATNVKSDEKTVARRVERLVKLGVIKSFTIDADWAKLGLNNMAYISTRTAVDLAIREKLFAFFQKEPRILKVDATVGAYEYVLLAVDRDVSSLRENVAEPLEPLTAGLSTSLISKIVKLPNYESMIRLIKEHSKRSQSKTLGTYKKN